MLANDVLMESKRMLSSFDLWPYKAYDLWPLTCELWPVTCDLWALTCDLWPVSSDLWPVSCDLWALTCDLWPVSSDLWPVTFDLWPVTCDICVCVCVKAFCRITRASFVFRSTVLALSMNWRHSATINSRAWSPTTELTYTWVSCLLILVGQRNRLWHN